MDRKKKSNRYLSRILLDKKASFKRWLAKIPGVMPFYLRVFLPLHRKLIRYPLSRQFYPQMRPKKYTKKRFYQQLNLVRQSYAIWKKIEAENKHQKLMTNYTHPYWRRVRKKVQAYLENTMDENFLRRRLIAHNIGWGMTTYPKPMLDYLLSQNDPIKKFTKRFVDSRVGRPILDPINNLDFPRVTTGSILQLFYLARIVRELNCHPVSCLDLGGGYGGLAWITRLYNPKVTLVTIDFPEVLSIQQLYYKINFFKRGYIYFVLNILLQNADSFDHSVYCTGVYNTIVANNTHQNANGTPIKLIGGESLL